MASPIEHGMNASRISAAALGLAICTAAAVCAQRVPETTPGTRVAVAKAMRTERAHPQVIYNRNVSPQTAAALHAQAKAAELALPIDGEMPTSLQMSRANANAAAVQTATVPPTPTAQPTVHFETKQRTIRSAPNASAKSARHKRNGVHRH